MTNDERIELNNKCADLYGVPTETIKYIPISAEAAQDYISVECNRVGVLLIDDWSRLMPLVVEHDVSIDFFYVNRVKTGYGVVPEVEEWTTLHPSKAHAVKAATVKALIAKKESEK